MSKETKENIAYAAVGLGASLYFVLMILGLWIGVDKASAVIMPFAPSMFFGITGYAIIQNFVLAITGAQETGKVLSPLNEKKSGHGHWPKPDGPGVAWPPPGNES